MGHYAAWLTAIEHTLGSSADQLHTPIEQLQREIATFSFRRADVGTLKPANRVPMPGSRESRRRRPSGSQPVGPVLSLVGGL